MRSLAHKGITWHDDPSPTEKDLLILQKKYEFHDLDIEDCLSEHERPKIEEYDKYLFLVFHIPYLKSDNVLKEEVDIFVGPDFFVTLHKGKIARLDMLWKRLQESEKKRDEYLANGTGFFLYELINHFFDDVFPLVDSVRREIRRIESQIFEGTEVVDLLRDIMNVKRNIITMRSILLPQRSLIANIEHKNKKFVPEELGLYFDDIMDAIERQWSMLETSKEMIDAMQDAHESFLRDRTNTIVRTLTIFSVMMLPLTVVTGLYGMNVHLPYQQDPWAFLWIVGVLTVSLIAALAFFWKRKWL